MNGRENKSTFKLASRLCITVTILSSLIWLSGEVEAADSTPKKVTTVEQDFAVKEVLKGDVNGDGVISSGDALLVTKHIKGTITLTPEQIKAADMNNDGLIDKTDSGSIMDIFLGITIPTSKLLEIPKGLKMEILNHTSINLSWDTLKEVNKDVTGFSIYQDNVLIGTTNETRYLVNSLDPQKRYYTFTIRSKNNAGDESQPSISMIRFKKNPKGDVNGDGVITPEDALLVTKHIEGILTLTPEQINIADMNNNGLIDQTDSQSIMNIHFGITPISKPLEIPKGLKIETSNFGSVELSWDALQESNNDTIVFLIYKDDVFYGGTNRTSFETLWLDPEKEHTFTIRSKDMAGNESGPSNSVKKAALKKYTYTYNSAGRLTSIVFLSGKKIVYTYDANGNLIKTTITNP
ncbi:hypothetical protein C0Q44_27145 [Paenibacillus sp. PCH8]|uniref:dockerin type I domain-containing protein n=1 Tax=Paenibacillus sp. PCH8 TaxID=2066524 RepID=UPI000CF8CC2F|nr:dockerin type I domain-containing protein [Paenibacillus sp. PCH8]PQP80574.1 hypothetical protein C0Q44_27145 [Paenibacillus sp. PCH8]